MISRPSIRRTSIAPPPRAGGADAALGRRLARRFALRLRRRRHDHRRQIEEAGEAVAVLLGGIVIVEALDIEREAGIAVHEAHDVAALVHHQRHGLVLADGDADAAGEPGDGT
jgi:hypothetical protein